MRGDGQGYSCPLGSEENGGYKPGDQSRKFKQKTSGGGTGPNLVLGGSLFPTVPGRGGKPPVRQGTRKKKLEPGGQKRPTVREGVRLSTGGGSRKLGGGGSCYTVEKNGRMEKNRKLSIIRSAWKGGTRGKKSSEINTEGGTWVWVVTTKRKRETKKDLRKC